MRKSFFLLIVLFIPCFAFSQQKKEQPVYVIVHGAWGGSWAFKQIDSLLTAKGCLVYRPSLTGQGDRVHLASPEVGLTTHIADVVNTILFENLRNVVLVGHSYGGMVITGVADSIPDRIKTMIYVDAAVPADGQNMLVTMGARAEQLSRGAAGGFIVPAWVKANAPLPKDVPQSLKTFTEPIRIKGRAGKIPVTYILTVAKGIDPSKDDFAAQAEKARGRGWKMDQLEADHNPQWSAVLPYAEILYKYR